jgi:hypothetical protein
MAGNVILPDLAPAAKPAPSNRMEAPRRVIIRELVVEALTARATEPVGTGWNLSGG